MLLLLFLRMNGLIQDKNVSYMKYKRLFPKTNETYMFINVCDKAFPAMFPLGNIYNERVRLVRWQW